MMLLDSRPHDGFQLKVVCQHCQRVTHAAWFRVSDAMVAAADAEYDKHVARFLDGYGDDTTLTAMRAALEAALEIQVTPDNAA